VSIPYTAVTDPDSEAKFCDALHERASLRQCMPKQNSSSKRSNRWTENVPLGPWMLTRGSFSLREKTCAVATLGCVSSHVGTETGWEHFIRHQEVRLSNQSAHICWLSTSRHICFVRQTRDPQALEINKLFFWMEEYSLNSSWEPDMDRPEVRWHKCQPYFTTPDFWRVSVATCLTMF